MTLPVRGAARTRRGAPPVRRASTGVSAGRIAAGVLVVAMCASLYGVAHSSAFTLDDLRVSGAGFTDEPAIESALGLTADAHPNLFTYDTQRARAALLTLPAVTDARVEVSLPRSLDVHLVERTPILTWSLHGTRWLVDVQGVVLGMAPAGAGTAAGSTGPGAGSSAAAAARGAGSTGAPGTPGGKPAASGMTEGSGAGRTPAPRAPVAGSPAAGPGGGPVASPLAASAVPVVVSVAPDGNATTPPAVPTGAAGMGATAGAAAYARLPVFIDQRANRPQLAPGAVLDPTDLDVARHLGALTPESLGSAAPSLVFTVTDRDGYAVRAGSAGWRAIFGIYTATIRPPTLIPAQVQCLRSLLASAGETRVQTVYLFPEGDQCGTFTAADRAP